MPHATLHASSRAKPHGASRIERSSWILGISVAVGAKMAVGILLKAATNAAKSCPWYLKRYRHCWFSWNPSYQHYFDFSGPPYLPGLSLSSGRHLRRGMLSGKWKAMRQCLCYHFGYSAVLFQFFAAGESDFVLHCGIWAGVDNTRKPQESETVNTTTLYFCILMYIYVCIYLYSNKGTIIIMNLISSDYDKILV